MRVALVHDYLTQRGGAERVVLALAGAFPDAPIHTSLYEPRDTFAAFSEMDVRPSFLNRSRWLRAHHRWSLPLLPMAFASMNLGEIDVALCSSSGWAHGARCSAPKVVYCHSPAKWLYRRDDYMHSIHSGSRALASRSLDCLKPLDRRAALSARAYVANSRFVAHQIEQIYGFAAEVLPPPLADLKGRDGGDAVRKPDQFLTVARLLPYKNVGALLVAFAAMPDLRLIVVGDGPEREKLASSLPPNVTLAGQVDDHELVRLYTESAGLLSASREDFGLTPVEAASFGLPTAALRWGGHLDTIVEGATGVLFDDLATETISAAVRELSLKKWDTRAIVAHSHRFSRESFERRIREIVTAAMTSDSEVEDRPN